MADDSDDERNSAQLHKNQPYDESLDVEGEEIASIYSPTPRVTQQGARLGIRPRPQGPGRSRGSTPPDARMMDPDIDDEEDDEFNDQINPPDKANERRKQTHGIARNTTTTDHRPIVAQRRRDSITQYADQMRHEDQMRLHAGNMESMDNDIADDDEDDDEDDDDDDDDFLSENNRHPGPMKPDPINQQMGPSLGQGMPPSGPKEGGVGQMQQGQFNSEEDDDDDESGSDDSDDDDDDDDEDDDHVALEGAYDPADYENLPVTPEIKELFQYITRYTPQSIELEHKLKPFIPDFIPAVGDIDAFVKISRPDMKPDTLGLTVLDEPCAKQSDPVVLDLQLRAISKQQTDKKLIVKSLSEAEKNPKQIDGWIESIRELHRHKPPPNVHYLKNMPDIDTLMQEWPPEFEDLLKEVGLPTADLDCDLAQYVDLICAILDIPIYKNTNHHNERVQALHVLFTLFSEFKNSQHFRALADENKLDNALKTDYHEDQGPDRFVL